MGFFQAKGKDILAQKGRKLSTLGFLKRFLFVVIVGLLFYNISFIFAKDYLFKKRLPEMSNRSSQAQALSQETESDFSAFLKETETKKVFAAVQATKAASSGVDQEKVAKIIEALKVVGIIDGKPQKAIIEDTKSGKSFYLKEGESFLENIQVQKIEGSTVVLDSYGQEFELYF